MYHIPKERILVDAISLDVEIRLEKELYDEEMRPILAAWDAYLPRRTWPQILPMLVLEIEPDWHTNFLQNEFLKHLVFQGEIAAGEAHGLMRQPGFQTALGRLKELYRGHSMEHILDSANLMWELQRDIKAVA